ncbi:hypothetical protein DY000_02008620 [Brassica cretica]|uniref:Uncharacterized protein n=1 Tax=Brassica cretica TaxID=69181 RepID=A0ABQ7BV28_BRACR|nr:hypothetical protein DY000_02008620 [Brassica cretica]
MGNSTYKDVKTISGITQPWKLMMNKSLYHKSCCCSSGDGKGNEFFKEHEYHDAGKHHT